jgi:hypothetical protein
MRITSCVPLAGQGVIARYGELVAVTDGRGPDDPLLGAIAETAQEHGDGGALVIRAARAALNARRQAAWACAGTTPDGGLAVLVHGPAAATLRVDGGPEFTLTVSDTGLPVSRTFTGSAITVILVIGGAEPPDERFWLGDGVMRGGGLALTASVGARPQAPGAWPPEARPRAGASPADVPWPSVPRADAPRTDVPRAEARPAAGPEIRQTAVDVLPVLDGGHPPTLDTPGTGVPGPAQPGPAGPEPVLVDGVLCASGHFNDPAAWSCRDCGLGLDQSPRRFDRRPRPSLGELVMDDGTRFPLDADYVLGREPALDGDVLAGRARPLRVNDPNGTVSRLHLKISLTDWQVEISDLGSANGSVLQTPGEERTLTPFAPAAIEPGARISIGHRSMQYVAYQGA